MLQIGFIGVGVMGSSMVRNLLKGGYPVQVYSRRKASCEGVIADGALWCDDIAACVKNADVVITIVGYPKDVEEVYFGQKGIIANAKKGATLIDMTTTSPRLAQRIYQEANEKELKALDAPVSGGDTGAKNGTLSIMVGGDQPVFDAMKPVFEKMGTNILLVGSAGAGQHVKMANQIALGGALAGVCEAMLYAKSAGVDVETMLGAISKGAAGSWQMSNMAPRMLKGDFNPGFFVKHYIKDLTIASEEAEGFGIQLDVESKVLEMYKALAQEGLGDLGTQALIKFYDKEF